MIKKGINQAVKDLSSIEKKLEKWYGAFEIGALEPDELAERIKKLQQRKAYLQNQIMEMENKLEEENERQINAEELLEILQDFPRIWENATADERREIVINTVKAVKVRSDNRGGSGV